MRPESEPVIGVSKVEAGRCTDIVKGGTSENTGATPILAGVIRLGEQVATRRPIARHRC